MRQSVIKVAVHGVWATRRRASVIDAECDPLLRGVFAGQLRRLNGHILAFGAWNDHVHVLFDLGAEASVSEAFRAMKGASALALSKQLALRFLWQEGYAAFAVERANVPIIAEYVNGQRQRHATAAISDELELLLHDACSAPRLCDDACSAPRSPVER